MAKKLFSVIFAAFCIFGLWSCQASTDQTKAPEQVVNQKPESPVPFSKGPSGPPHVNGPTAPPPEFTGDTQAVTEKETGTYTLPAQN